MREPVKAFNSVAESYDAWYRHPQGAQILEAELNLLSRQLPPCGLGLEVGAGTGAFAERMKSPCRDVVCIDPSSSMIIRARDRGLKTIIGVGDHLPLRSKTFDFSYMATVVEFLTEPVKTFTEVKAVIKENSALSILFINPASSWGELYREIGLKGDPVFRHAKLIGLHGVTRLLSEAGYEIEASMGTLTTGPMEPNVGAEIMAPSDACGVIAVKAKAIKKNA